MSRTLCVSVLLCLAFLALLTSRTAAQAPPPVLIDHSHELPDVRNQLESLLNKAGVGVVVSNASLASLGDRLLQCQPLLIWQEPTPVPYPPDEVKLIRNYVSKGGTLLLIGNAADWTGRNKPASANDYPLFKLMKALGLNPTDADQRKTLGKGLVVFLRRDDVLTPANIRAEAAAAPGKAAERLLAAIPDRRTVPSPTNVIIEPDKSFTVGFVDVRYPANLAEPAEAFQTFITKVTPVFEKIFDAPLEAKVTITALPCTGTPWIPAHDFEVNLAAPPAALAEGCGRQLAYCWLFPGGRDVSQPDWITWGWVDAASARAISAVGFAAQADALLGSCRRHLQDTDPKLDKIDLSAPPPADLNAYRGKAIHVLETLEKQTGKNVLARFRKAIRIAHGAGEIEDKLDTDQAVRLLSLSLNQDLYPFFTSVGTRVVPKPLDFDRFRKLEAELDRLLRKKK